MDNETLYVWSETIPNWLMALSAVSAAVVFLWRRQDKKESQALREAEIRDRVNAVWATACIDSDDKPRWGILVSNELHSPVTDLRVQCHGNDGTHELIHGNVHPGKYFFESVGKGRPLPWKLPTSNFIVSEYITASPKHSVRGLSFVYSDTRYSKELGN